MSTQFIPFWFETKYFGETSRIKATYNGANGVTTSVYVPYDHSLGGSNSHKLALLKLMEHPKLKELYPQYEIVAYTEFPKDKSSYWWSVQQVYSEVKE
jgi:hypothetical protein